MGVDFTPDEGCAVYRLWADSTNDIILKTDRSGNIVGATPALERWPFASGDGVSGRHILDLVHPSRCAAVMAEHEAVIEGRQNGGWIEFPARLVDGQEHWYEIQSRGLLDDAGAIHGVVSIVRSIQERRLFEERLFMASMTDTLTGLSNRSAFVSMLQHLVDSQIGGCLAMFDIDHFKAINMRYGHTVGDQLLVAFSELIRAITGDDDIISRIGGESFGILFPETAIVAAEEICGRIMAALGEPGGASGTEGLPMTVSVGLTRIATTLDESIKAAELALTVAKAKGRNRLEVDHGIPVYQIRSARAG